ncbi:MAG TPA: tetratricopeptide repeat protein, partial [Thermoanaerobaculia bacterium]
ELGSDLKRHLANEPVLAGPPSGTYRLRKLVRKHRTAFAAVAAVAVSLVLGIAGTGWMAVVASREQAAAESARDSARREAEVAKATTKFVRQMLMAPDPWKSFTASREIKVIEVLDKARDQLRDLEKQPEVAAHLRSTLGETYFQLGATEEAMPLLAESIRDHERLYGAEHPLTLTARHNHAEALDRNADYVAAEKEARAIYRLRERILGRDHVDTITSLAFAARMHMRQGRTKEAEPIFRDVLARSRRVLGPDHKVTLMVANELAECVKPLRGNAEALTLGRDVLERRARTLGPDHPDTVNTMNNLAGALFVRGETAEAVDMYRRVVDTYTRVLGADHPRTLTARNNLAVTLYGSKRHEETEVEMRYIAEAQARVRGPEHPNTLTAQNNLARIVLERGRANEALAMYNKLLPVATRVLPAHHWDLALYRFGYGLTLAKLGDFKRAQLEIENAHKDLLDKYGPNDSRTKNVAAKLALIREGKLPPELSASKRSL